MPNFLGLLRKYSRCCAFLTSWVVLSVQVRSSLMWTPKYLKRFTLSTSRSRINSVWWVLLFFSHVHYSLLCLVSVEGDVVVLTPCHKTGHLPPVGCFISASDPSYHCGVASELHNDFVLVGGNTVMCQQCVEDGTENTPLWSADVCYDGVWGPICNPDRLRTASHEVFEPSVGCSRPSANSLWMSLQGMTVLKVEL